MITSVQTHSLDARPHARGAQAAILALVFLVALNLRPALTVLGPLLPAIGDDLVLSETSQGLLSTLPLLAFAAVSPLVHMLSLRTGIDKLVLVALLVLIAGLVMRSLGGATALWLGTVTVGCAIAIGNVLVPAIVKRDYAGHVSFATGVYSAFITVGAAIASAAAVPIAIRHGWQTALACWAIPAGVVTVLWALRLRWVADAPARTAVPAEPAEAALLASTVALPKPDGSVWRKPAAWWITAFMGLQSTTFYLTITWLPTIEQSFGVPEEQTGFHLFLFQVVGIFTGLAITRLLDDARRRVIGAVIASVPMVIGAIGLLMMPQISVIWAMIAGLGTGASLVVALSLISLRGRTPAETTQLSGMAQSLGYLLAALGPVTAGFLAEQTGNWSWSLGMLAGLAVCQLLVSIPAARLTLDRKARQGTGSVQPASPAVDD